MNKVSVSMKKRIAALKGSPESEANIASPIPHHVTPAEIKVLLEQSIQIEHLGSALAHLRQVKGLTTRELGTALGLSQP
jgi:hypothetical protein